MRLQNARELCVRVSEACRKAFKRDSSEHFPEESAVVRVAAPLAFCVLLGLALIATWYAARRSSDLEEQRLSAELHRVANEVASTQIALKAEQDKTQELQRALHASGGVALINLEARLRRDLLEAQAQANQYKAILDRQQDMVAENTGILETLSRTGAHLFPMRRTEGAGEGTGYALMVENYKLMFIGSNLPSPAERHRFQLWMIRKQEPKVVSCALFTPDDNHNAVLSFDQASLLSDVASIEVTDEPDEGSAVPTGNRLFQAEIPKAE